ncbi:MAG: hypothetical protein J5J00_09720 [Deltaproteobacteria bacterium]|nr:hypothetical protein [Deltaproteobacteria bacterium]
MTLKVVRGRHYALFKGRKETNKCLKDWEFLAAHLRLLFTRDFKPGYKISASSSLITATASHNAATISPIRSAAIPHFMYARTVCGSLGERRCSSSELSIL